MACAILWVLPYKQRVGGSNPSAPTLEINDLQRCKSFFVAILYDVNGYGKMVIKL